MATIHTRSHHEDITNAVQGMIRAAVRDWLRRACADPFATMRAYYKPREISCYIGTEGLNDDWLDSGLVVSSAWGEDEAARRVWEVFQSLPLIPEYKEGPTL